MKQQVKQRANSAYRWMEGNPATAILVSAGVSALLTLGLILGLGLYSSKTFATKSACTRNPAGKECAEIRQAVARAEPIAGPCISFQRVTNQRGKNCPEQFVRDKKKRDRETQGPVRGGGGASQVGSTGYQVSGPEGGSEGGVGNEKGRGGAGGGSGGGQAKPPAGSPTTSDPAPVPSASSPRPSPGKSSDAAGDPESKTDSAGTVSSTLEATGAAVKEAGEGVGGAVEGAGKAACTVLGCP